tara:strand:+ start:337 stop:561 length:225 start_codon:yes stop_codon:yes gene_type:complete
LEHTVSTLTALVRKTEQRLPVPHPFPANALTGELASLWTNRKIDTIASMDDEAAQTILRMVQAINDTVTRTISE